ncbi:MAG: hypothetical protein ABS35_36505 [Kaistia sp. SCN 65-12]|nr:MAG: hypothetical protein ABS35_36505 [Kaistia sp. SCN 65-12]
MTAILMVPLLGAAGLALDFSQALALKTRLQGAADSAALGAIAESSAGVQKAILMSGDGEVSLGTDDAMKFFMGQLGENEGFTLDSLEARVVKKDNQGLSQTFSERAIIP